MDFQYFNSEDELFQALNEMIELGYVKEFYIEGDPEPFYELTDAGLTHYYNAMHSN